MIKSIIIMALLAVIGYSYITDSSVKSIMQQHDIKIQTPIVIKNL